MTGRKEKRILKHFAKRLHVAMIASGYSQKSLASKLEVNPKTVYNWTHSVSEPNLFYLQRLGCLLNVSVDGLLGLERCIVEIEMVEALERIPDEGMKG